VQVRDFSKLTKNFSFWHINLEILWGKGKLIVNRNKIIMCRTIYLCSPGIAASSEDHHPLYGK